MSENDEGWFTYGHRQELRQVTQELRGVGQGSTDAKHLSGPRSQERARVLGRRISTPGQLKMSSVVGLWLDFKVQVQSARRTLHQTLIETQPPWFFPVLRKAAVRGVTSPRVLETDSCPHAVPINGVRARQLGGQLSAGSGKGQSRRKTRMHVVGAREGVQSLRIAAGLYVR